MLDFGLYGGLMERRSPALLSDPTTLSIAPLTARMDTCELCLAGPEALRAAIMIRHARGGTISFAGCDRCAAAMRRIIAAAGGASTNGPAHVSLVSSEEATLDLAAAEGDLPPDTLTPGDFAPDAVGAPVLVHDFLEPFVAKGGQPYVVRAYGQERADGTWIGWLTFVGADGQTIKRTPRETTQSSQDHLAYWASGLQQSYLEGAFQRAS
jgi:hypothetical protein